MAKWKKQSEEKKNKKGDKESRSGIINGDAKRGIVAVFLFAVAFVLALGFFGLAGVFGDFLNKIISALFGWIKWTTPFFIVFVGWILLLRKESSFYFSKIGGIFGVFLSILGFTHIFFNKSETLKMAAAGKGGGYIGYGLAYVLQNFMGSIAGGVVLVAVFLICAIIVSNFSIVNFFRNRLKEKENGENENGDVGEKEEVKAEITEREIKKEKKIEFVKGPDEKSASNNNKFGMSIFKKKNQVSAEEFVPLTSVAENENWKLPSPDILESSSKKAQGGDVKGRSEIIQNTFRHFGIEVEAGEIKVGPTITQYSYRPAVGIKLSKITTLGNDLALALAAHPIRIEAPIPGKSLIGIEVPNKSVADVRLKDILKSESFKEKKSPLSLLLGKDVNGDYMLADLQKMPHLMIAGSTGSGKSVSVNSIILSLLYQNSPDDLKLILVDPKRVELSNYNGIPHLLSDVVVENAKVVNALRWAIGEMERRYKILQETGSKDLNSYVEKFRRGEKRKIKNEETGEETFENLERLPFIVIIIDELADLMISHGKEVEGAIIRLAQMARAVGIHLIVSTQRPSVEVLTGLIKANIATRIAFRVATQIDSRTILDTGGAEKLLGNGDMLFSSNQFAGLKRLQGVFVSESETKKVVKFIKSQKIERADEVIGDNILAGENGAMKESGGFSKIDFSQPIAEGNRLKDDLYEQAKKIVIETRKASTSFLQRRLGIGYNRAAKIIDELEAEGVIGPSDGSKSREVYFSAQDTTYEDPLNDQAKRDKWKI